MLTSVVYINKLVLLSKLTRLNTFFLIHMVCVNFHEYLTWSYEDNTHILFNYDISSEIFFKKNVINILPKEDYLNIYIRLTMNYTK